MIENQETESKKPRLIDTYVRTVIKPYEPAKPEIKIEEPEPPKVEEPKIDP